MTNPLGSKYDEMYCSSPAREMFIDAHSMKRPRDRFQAIVAMGGEGETILDVGCGNGYLLYQFRNSFARLIGLELSSKRLAQAQRNLADFNFVPFQGSAEQMQQIDTASVDRIVSADTIEHISDVYAALKEMHRVLKPDGVLVINTPNIAFIKKRVLLCFGRFPATSQPNEGIGDSPLFDGGHLHYFTFRSLGNLLERSGFQLQKRIGFGPYPILQNLYPPLLSGGVQWMAKKRSLADEAAAVADSVPRRRT